jgi:hypothetical protein
VLAGLLGAGGGVGDLAGGLVVGGADVALWAVAGLANISLGGGLGPLDLLSCGGAEFG